MPILKPATIAFALSVSVLLAPSALAQGGGGGRGGDGPPPGDRPAFDPAQIVDRMMENDANGDGKLSPDEVPGRFAEQMFPVADADKDGFLTREELTTYFANRPRGGGFGQPQPPAGAGGPEATFDGHMRQAGQALRAMRRSPFTAESQADDLIRIGVIEASLVGAKARIDPERMAPQAKAKYGNNTALYMHDMRLSVLKAIKASIALEEAILMSDTAGSKAALEKLLAAQKEGHDQFQEEEEEGGPRRGNPPAGRGNRGGGGGAGGGGGGNGG